MLPEQRSRALNPTTWYTHVQRQIEPPQDYDSKKMVHAAGCAEFWVNKTLDLFHM